MKRSFLETLKKLKGQKFAYANKEYLLEDYTIDDVRQRVTIRTDKRTFEKIYSEIEEFLSCWMPVGELPAATVPAVKSIAPTKKESAPAVDPLDAVFEQHNSLTDDLITVLKENIQKVRENKDYIPQAQAINNNINSIINVTKLKLDVYKQFKKKAS